MDVKFSYRNSPQYTDFYSNGVIGGATGRNEVVLHFFLETNSLPRSSVHDLTETGMSPTPKEEIKDGDANTLSVIREIKSTVVLSYDSAKSINDWLSSQLKILEERQK